MALQALDLIKECVQNGASDMKPIMDALDNAIEDMGQDDGSNDDSEEQQ